MNTNYQNRVRFTVKTLIGLSVLGLAAVRPASAQDTATIVDPKTGLELSTGYLIPNEVKTPAPLTYPYAAPGALDLYHFDSYRREVLTSGSASEAQDEMRAKERRAIREHRIVIRDDATYAMPMAMQYPYATPGALDLYHFNTYNANVLTSGSVRNTAEDRIALNEHRSMFNRPLRDNGFVGITRPMNYPMASPGGMELFHFQPGTQGTGPAAYANMDQKAEDLRHMRELRKSIIKENTEDLDTDLDNE